MNGKIDPTYRDRVLRNMDHHRPDDEQLERITAIRHAAKAFAATLMDKCVFDADLERALACAREAMMFSVASVVLEDSRAISREPTQPTFTLGQRIYHRRADLFGRIETFMPDKVSASVKYEWPYDAAADAKLVPVSELMHADKADKLMEAASAGLLRHP